MISAVVIRGYGALVGDTNPGLTLAISRKACIPGLTGVVTGGPSESKQMSPKILGCILRYW